MEMKSLLVKTHKEGGDPYEAMLEQRNAPRKDTGRSPAEMMFNRRTRSFLPSISNSPMDPFVKEKREASQRSVKKAHDQKSRRLKKIDVGQSVFFQHTAEQNWKLGEFTNVLGLNTYQISGSSGGNRMKHETDQHWTKVSRPVPCYPASCSLCVLDVTPLTLPLKLEEAPKGSNPPKDPSVGNSQPCSGNRNITPTDSPERSLSANRARREKKSPIRFKDYVTK